jgi:hypothetical protein
MDNKDTDLPVFDPEAKTRGEFLPPGETNTFDISLRLLGNEILGFTLTANNPKNKWLLAGLLALGAMMLLGTEFGPALMDLVPQ